MTASLRRRSLLTASGALVVATSFAPFVTSRHAHAQQLSTLSISTAINRAGRLRAISQRTAKAYAQGVLGVLPERTPGILKTCQDLTAAIFAELGRGSLPAEVQKPLNTVRADMEKMFELGGQGFQKQKLADIARLSEDALVNADAATSALERSTEKSTARIVNTAGRQRMLSQRMAKAYFLSANDTDPAAMRKQLAMARADFVAALGTLSASPISNDAIKAELLMAQSQWAFFDAALSRPAAGTAPRDVASTSERMLEIMDGLTNQYDRALKEVLGSLPDTSRTSFAERS